MGEREKEREKREDQEWEERIEIERKETKGN